MEKRRIIIRKLLQFFIPNLLIAFPHTLEGMKTSQPTLTHEFECFLQSLNQSYFTLEENVDLYQMMKQYAEIKNNRNNETDNVSPNRVLEETRLFFFYNNYLKIDMHRFKKYLEQTFPQFFPKTKNTYHKNNKIAKVFQAIQDYDIETLKQAFSSLGMNVNNIKRSDNNNNNETAFIYAIRKGFPEALEFFLERGARLTYKGYTAYDVTKEMIRETRMLQNKLLPLKTGIDPLNFKKMKLYFTETLKNLEEIKEMLDQKKRRSVDENFFSRYQCPTTRRRHNSASRTTDLSRYFRSLKKSSKFNQTNYIENFLS